MTGGAALTKQRASSTRLLQENSRLVTLAVAREGSELLSPPEIRMNGRGKIRITNTTKNWGRRSEFRWLWDRVVGGHPVLNQGQVLRDQRSQAPMS